jgi:hypothetical protein
VELALVRPGELTLRAAGPDRPLLGVQDVDGVLTRWLRDASASAVRIRPDRIVRAGIPRRRGTDWMVRNRRRVVSDAALAQAGAVSRDRRTTSMSRSSTSAGCGAIRHSQP